MENIKLIHGDCIEEMQKLIGEGVKVDMVLTDPPYGTTACKWDIVIPFDRMWACLDALINVRGAIVLFGSEPFSSALRVGNIRNYKYDWVWNKKAFANQMMAKKQPLRIVENIMVFNAKVYNPQNIISVNRVTKQGRKITDNIGGGVRGTSYVQTHTNYPRNILDFSKDRPSLHPTQKPVALLEYLIKTYTNEGDTVLDFTMGSGSTAIACMNTNRKFIGIELDDNYYRIAVNRVSEALGDLD